MKIFAALGLVVLLSACGGGYTPTNGAGGGGGGPIVSPGIADLCANRPNTPVCSRI